MFRLAARLVGNTADAEDVVQEAFVKALASLRAGEFRGQAALTTWLFRITTNVACDRLRRARTAERPSEEPSTDGQADARVALRELHDAMSELPPDQRAALVLKELQGLTTREVAEVLERSEGATEQLLVRARETLRRRFES